MNIMKMRPLIIAGAITVGLLACNNTSQNETRNAKSETNNTKVADTTPVSYSIDVDKSVVNWKGSMVGVYAHEGTVAISKGSLTVKNGLVIDGDFTVDLNSMVTTDSDGLYKMAPREQLIGHLKSDDFFGTEKFPFAVFKIKSVEGDVLTGDLTVKGVTHEESVNSVKLTESNGAATGTGSLVFERQKYGIIYKNKMGDMVLSDDIELAISISATAI